MIGGRGRGAERFLEEAASRAMHAVVRLAKEGRVAVGPDLCLGGGDGTLAACSRLPGLMEVWSRVALRAARTSFSHEKNSQALSATHAAWHPSTVLTLASTDRVPALYPRFRV